MRAQGFHARKCDSNFRVAVTKKACTDAAYRYLRRNREMRSSRWRTKGLLLLLPLTVVISMKFVSAKAVAVGVPASAESARAIELSPCKLSGVEQPARCGVLEVPENPTRPAGRQLKIGVAVIPAAGGKRRPDSIVRQGHTEWNECIAKIYKKVVISGSVGGGGTSTCPLVPRPPFRLK